MLRWLGRAVLACAWVAVLGVACVAAAYVSFNLMVRRGTVSVPEVAGLPLADAIERLRDLGLRVQHDAAASRPDEAIPAGAVVATRPPIGAPVKRGGLVELVASLGPESLVVPDVAGTEVQAALVAFAAAGLQPGLTHRVASAETLAGRIVETIPPAGSPAPRGRAVTMIVSEGPRAATFVMPDLVTGAYEPARRTLEAAGFRFGRVTFERYESIAPGTILRQFPLPGHPVTRSEAISLAVAVDDERTM